MIKELGEIPEQREALKADLGAGDRALALCG
jgi:hypothetical protein